MAKVGLGVLRLLGTEVAQPCLGLQMSLWMGTKVPGQRTASSWDVPR